MRKKTKCPDNNKQVQIFKLQRCELGVLKVTREEGREITINNPGSMIRFTGIREARPSMTLFHFNSGASLL